MLQRHVSTVVQNGQTKCWLSRGPFTFFLTATVGSPACEKEDVAGMSVQFVAICNLTASLEPKIINEKRQKRQMIAKT